MGQPIRSEIGILMYEKQLMLSVGNCNGAEQLDKIIRTKIRANMKDGSISNITGNVSHLYREDQGYDGAPITDANRRESN